MNPQAVRAELEKRFTFFDELRSDHGTEILRHLYRGSFAGFETDRLEVVFHRDKLVGLVVLMYPGDTRPASRRWKEIVERMTRSYGAPTSSVAASFDRAAERRPPWERNRAYRELDKQIVAGEYRPIARWRFRNRAEIVVGMSVAKPDERGDRQVLVRWTFISPHAGVWGKSARAGNPRDY